MAVVVEAEDRFNRMPDLDREDGSALGWYDRLFIGYRDGKIFDYSDWAARDLAAMMRKPGKHRQIENVLTYPTLAAERKIIPGKGGSEEIRTWLEDFFQLDEFSGGCETPLDLVIDQMTSAAVYKKSFHEIEWTAGLADDYAGQIIPKGIYWRPQTTTRLLRDPNRGGRMVGIEQDPVYLGDKVRSRGNIDLIEIPMKRALVHIHGARRDPINGLSDLEVAYWAYKTQQKIMFLWMQFAEGVSLPRALVKSQDVETSRSVARSIAAAKGSGVIPVGTDGRPDSVSVDVLNMSGEGNGVFKEIMYYLDQCSVDSVMAGFLNLTGNEKSGGSNALSADASDFFLMTLESKNREIERDLRRGLFAPMTRYNFGPRAVVPALKFEPLNAEDKTAAIEMLKGLMTSRDPALVPDEFIGFLVEEVTNYLGGDGTKIAEAFQGAAEKAKRMAAENSISNKMPGMATPGGQKVAAIAGATQAATAAVRAAKKGSNPVKAAKKAVQ